MGEQFNISERLIHSIRIKPFISTKRRENKVLKNLQRNFLKKITYSYKKHIILLKLRSILHYWKIKLLHWIFSRKISNLRYLRINVTITKGQNKAFTLGATCWILMLRYNLLAILGTFVASFCWPLILLNFNFPGQEIT